MNFVQRRVYGLAGWITLIGELAACGSGDGGGSADAGSVPDGGNASGGDGSVLFDGPRGDGGGSSACDSLSPVDGLTFHVNPIAGDDTTGTGSGTAGGAARAACAYRSITRAVAAATAAGQLRMSIIIDVTATAGVAETFPIVVPPQTTIAAAAQATVRVSVPSGDGLHLSGATSGLDSLIIDGQGAAANGVVATAGPITLSGVEVTGFAGSGIKADSGATLILTAGVNAHDNAIGLGATGTALVNIDGAGATEQQPTQISRNSGNGIEVRGQARVNLSGTPSTQTPGTGTVVVSGNAGDGIIVEQLLVAQDAAPPAGMTMTGLVVTQNHGSGMHFFGGSGVKVRSSFLSGNTLHGVFVQTDPAFVAGGSGANDGNDISRLDLGTASDAGHVTLQDSASPNGKKGVCLNVTTGSNLNGPLKLEGNIFASANSNVDCAEIAAALPATGDCDAAGPLGDTGRNPKNDFDVATCTVP